MTLLLELPTELLCRCLEFLDHLSLLSCRSVCHELKLAIDATKQCQYTLALAGAGLEDVPISSWSTADKLDAVRRYESAWRKLEYSSHTSLPWDSNGLWELYGGVWGHNADDGKALQFVQLPSAIRKIPQRQWRLSLDVVPRDFTFKPSHDLLVLIVNRDAETEQEGIMDPGPVVVHLRTLSEGVDHPLARLTQLVFPSELDAMPSWSYSIRVCGKHLGILRNHMAHTELVIWNWMEGTLCLRLWGENTLKSFMFLDENAIVVASLVVPDNQPGLEYTNSSLIVYDLERDAGGMDPESHQGTVYDVPFRVAFQLPRIPLANADRLLQIHSDPSPYVPGGSEPDVPFRLNSHDRLLTVNTMFIAEDRTMARTAVIPYDYIRQCASDAEPGDVLSTDHWHREAMYLPEHGMWSVWVCFVYGMRYVHPRLLGNEDDKLCVGMMDFHKTRQRVGAMQEGENEQSAHLIRPVTLVLPEELQKEDSRFLAVMISEDSILLLSRSSGPNERLHIFSF